MDGALRHSGELLPKDAVLMSVFTGLVFTGGKAHSCLKYAV